MSIPLTDEMFNPLDLDEAIGDAFEAGGREAVAERMAEALADPRAKGDPALADHLDELAELYGELEYYDKAIDTAYRLLEVDPDRREEKLCWIANLHAVNGETEQAMTLLRRWRAEYEELPATKQNLLLYLLPAFTIGDHPKTRPPLLIGLPTPSGPA